jgi:hypothetical protein
MHALMAAILLGMPGLDAFDANAQAKPPDGEFAEINRACAEAKGTPLSLRMLAGRPRSLKSLSNTVKAYCSRVEGRLRRSADTGWHDR